MNDEDMVKGIMSRNEKALESLIREYGGIIRAIAYKSLDENYRDECVNDVLFSVWKNISQFDPEKNSLKNWICSVCRYKCIDYRRRYLKAVFSELDENTPSKEMADMYLLQKETDREIEELLSNLSDKDREIFKRRYIYDEKPEEISKSMEIEPSVIYNHLSRGRRKLREIIARRSP